MFKSVKTILDEYEAMKNNPCAGKLPSIEYVQLAEALKLLVGIVKNTDYIFRYPNSFASEIEIFLEKNGFND